MKFHVDLSDVIQEFNLLGAAAERLTQQVVDDVTAEVYRKWARQAAQGLNSTRNEYVRSIYLGEKGKFRNVLVLRGMLPNMLEFGVEAFDMKAGFAKSAKAKRSKKGGWYLTIPFRWATPGSLGENAVFANVMPVDVYSLARQLSPRRSTVGASRPGQALPASALPARHQGAKTRAAVSNALTGQHFPAYTHRNPLLEGLQRNEHTYQHVKQNTYQTFRRVSDKSDPNSWIHSGLKQRDFATKAMQTVDFDTVVNNSVDNFLSSL